MIRVTLHNPRTGYLETFESESAVVLSTSDGDMTIAAVGVEDENELCDQLREAHDHARSQGLLADSLNGLLN